MSVTSVSNITSNDVITTSASNIQSPTNSTLMQNPILTSWDSVKKVVDRVHRHVCGHATFSDMRTLLIRNRLWSNEVQHYLSQTVSECVSCKASSTPPPNRRVSLSSLNRQLNEVVCVDHFHLDGVTLFHAMDTATRFSSAYVVESTGLDQAVLAFESCWLSQFWPPTCIHADTGFCKGEFAEMTKLYDIKLRPTPPNRHQKNMLEPRHGPIRSIFIRLRHASPTEPLPVLALRAVRVSNDIYGSDVISAYEAAKGYTRPINSCMPPVPVDHELVEAHSNLVARRKLTRILRSHSLTEHNFRLGDLVEVYQKRGKQKRGKWSSPRQVIAIDMDAGMLSVPGSAGHKVTVAFEEARAAHVQSDITSMIQEPIDKLDEEIDDLLDNHHSVQPSSNNCDPLADHESDASGESQPFLDEVPLINPTGENAESSNCSPDLLNEEDQSSTEKLQHTVDHQNVSSETVSVEIPQADTIGPSVGDRVEIFWTMDNMYYPGTVSQITESGEHVINYDDDDVETLTLSNETWRFKPSQSSLNAALGNFCTLPSDEQRILKEIMDVFGNKPFMGHQAQGFEQFPIVNAYRKEEDEFTKNVEVVKRSSVPPGSNIISSHVIYKVKMNDDATLKLKARIAPHGNEDSDKDQMRTDCCMCSPLGIRVVISVSVYKKWRIIRIDVKTAFLQTGRASRKVYVIPPRECRQRDVLWLLLAAAYGLENANAKWQVKSDSALASLGLIQSSAIPQLFVHTDRNGNIDMIVIKMVDDILATGQDDVLKSFVTDFGGPFALGEIMHGPGQLRFFGLNIVQHEDFSCSIDGDEKLGKIEPYPLSRVRRRQSDEVLNAIERSAFMSINASIGWLGITTSVLCAFHSSSLQQKLPNARVSSLMSQVAALNQLKRYGTLASYVCPPADVSSDVTLVAFADASHSAAASQLCFVTAIVFGKIQQGSVIHIMSWASHRSRRPVRSTPAAEILAAGEALDEIVSLKNALSAMLGIKVQLAVLVDSKDLYRSLSSQRHLTDKSVRADVNSICFYHETTVDLFGWIRGSCNPADVGTKLNSPLVETFALTAATGIIHFDLQSKEIAPKDRSLG